MAFTHDMRQTGVIIANYRKNTLKYIYFSCPP